MPGRRRSCAGADRPARGPHRPLHYWPVRLARGGRGAGPVARSRSVQYVDGAIWRPSSCSESNGRSRDLQGRPAKTTTMKTFLADEKAVGGDARLMGSADFPRQARRRGVRATCRSGCRLARGRRSPRSTAQGDRRRPQVPPRAETARDTLAWSRPSRGIDEEAAAGLSPSASARSSRHGHRGQGRSRAEVPKARNSPPWTGGIANRLSAPEPPRGRTVMLGWTTGTPRPHLGPRGAAKTILPCFRTTSLMLSVDPAHFRAAQGDVRSC